MAHHSDSKLVRLATLLDRHASHEDVRRLGRLGDLTTAAAGTSLQTEGTTTRWCYWVLDGTAVVETEAGGPLVVCGPGSWIPGGAGRPARRTPATVEALTDLDLVAFGVREYRGALATVPSIARVIERV